MFVCEGKKITINLVCVYYVSVSALNPLHVLTHLKHATTL